MIGRKKEMQELNDLYDSNRAELVAVYGRRRVGKTFLIDETFEGRFTFRHAGLSPVDQERKGMLKKQLDHFYYSLLRHGMKGGKKPKSWMEAFLLLEMFLEEQDDGDRQLLFFDELPWMDTPRSGFLTAFEGFWNTWGCHRKNLMVIVCGSANSWILDNLINNHGGLYNRVTYEIKLLPFTLKECELFFEDRGVFLSRYDIVQSYMAVGGIPYYLGYFKRNLSLAQNLDELFFRKNSKLREEYDRLFESIFDKPDLMKAIVKILYTRKTGFSRRELLESLQQKEGETISKCLTALISSEFIIKYVPFGSKQRECHYKLVDPFCSFWLHFVGTQGVNDEDFWQQNLNSQKIVSWRGVAFENVCWNHIPQIKSALGISGVSTNHSSWIFRGEEDTGLQVDLLIFRKDNIVNLCEMKYYGDEFRVESDDYRGMLHRSEILSKMISPQMSIHNTLITTYGLKKNKYSSIFSSLITLEDLFE